MLQNSKLFLNKSELIFKLFGMWLPIASDAVLLKVYMLIILLTQYIFVLFEIIYIAGVWGDIDAVSEASYLLFTQASVCYKTTAFLINRGKLARLLDSMDSEIFSPRNILEVRLLGKQSRIIKRLCALFLGSAVTTCTLWAMIPLFDDLNHKSFPFKIWMPITPEQSPGYELGYLYQMLSIYISALLFIGVDSVALCMIIFGCAQLEMIMEKIKMIKNVPLSLKTDEITIKQIKYKKICIKCVRHHQNIVRFIETVEHIFHANIFFQLSGTVVIICNILIRIAIVDHNSVQFFSMINYMVTMLSQLFLYCWCGNELTTRSEELRDQLYQCPWYDQSAKFKRALMITTERMKKPIIFKVGHYISLSRPTFVTILRCSYSYFAVLNRANKK